MVGEEDPEEEYVKMMMLYNELGETKEGQMKKDLQEILMVVNRDTCMLEICKYSFWWISITFEHGMSQKLLAL